MVRPVAISHLLRVGEHQLGRLLAMAFNLERHLPASASSEAGDGSGGHRSISQLATDSGLLHAGLRPDRLARRVGGVINCGASAIAARRRQAPLTPATRAWMIVGQGNGDS